MKTRRSDKLHLQESINKMYSNVPTHKVETVITKKRPYCICTYCALPGIECWPNFDEEMLVCPCFIPYSRLEDILG